MEFHEIPDLQRKQCCGTFEPTEDMTRIAQELTIIFKSISLSVDAYLEVTVVLEDHDLIV